MSENGCPWPIVPLGKLAADMCLGKMLDKAKNRGTLQPYLRNVNVRWFSFDLTDLKQMRFEDGEESRFGLKKGDLVICEGGEPGRAAVWEGQSGDAKIQKALHRVRFRSNEYDPRFAMYYLYFGTTTDRFASSYTGTTIKHLTGKALFQVGFPVPSLNEQKRIVAKIEELFSDLDAGVAALERAKANLKRYRAAVLKAAVEGKLTEAWRKENPATQSADQLLGRILAERRKRWEEEQLTKYTGQGKKPPKNWQAKYKQPAAPDTSNLPELPEGWCWTTIPHLAESCLGKMLDRKKHITGSPLPYLRNVNVRWWSIETTDVFKMNFENNDLERFALRKDDVLVCEGGEPGRAAVWDGRTDDMKFQKALHRIRCSSGLLPHYVVIVLEYMAKSGRLARFFTGSTIKHFTGESFARMPLPLPPIEEQATMIAKVDEQLTAIEHIGIGIDSDLHRADRLRQSILKRAFEGKLVPQDPTDEPASVLLGRIKAESGKSPPKAKVIRRPKGTKKRKSSNRQTSLRFGTEA